MYQEYVKTRNQRASSMEKESKENKQKSPYVRTTFKKIWQNQPTVLLSVMPCQNVGNCGGYPKCKLGHVDPKMNKRPDKPTEVIETSKKQEKVSNINMMIEKEIKSNNSVKYVKLDQSQMKAINYCTFYGQDITKTHRST